MTEYKPVKKNFRDIVSSQTSRARNRHEAALSQAKRMLHDSENRERHEKGLCPCCHYAPERRVVGHGFTNWTCRFCSKPDTHANTGVPMLCLSCSQSHGLCVRCMAQIDLEDPPVQPRPRKKVLP